MDELKQKALLMYLQESDYPEATTEDITEGYNESNFEAFGNEYNVFTEDEREEEVTEYIKESLWAFNASFLAGETELPEEVFKALSEKCESGNEDILKIVEKTCGLDSLVDSATSADGYGHFLSPYDGEEQEEKIEDTWFYIYRMN
jgi:hypothetical protein